MGASQTLHSTAWCPSCDILKEVFLWRQKCQLFLLVHPQICNSEAQARKCHLLVGILQPCSQVFPANTGQELTGSCFGEKC